MPTIKGNERVRLSLDISAQVKEKLESLETRTDAGSITEVIRRALAVYDLIIAQQEESGKIIFRYADGVEEVLRVL